VLAGRTVEARRLLEKAIATAPAAARARIELAGLQQAAGDQDSAFQTLRLLADAAPAAMPLAAARLAHAASASGQVNQALDLLQRSYDSAPSLDVLEAMVTLQQNTQGAQAREAYVRHLEREPSLVAAAKWLAGERLEHEQFHPQVQLALDHAVKPLTRYRCAACGFEAKQHFWQCPGCQTWDSYPARRVEEL
jgi:lipopolysaccharide biosynthesis regulator YciM